MLLTYAIQTKSFKTLREDDMEDLRRSTLKALGLEQYIGYRCGAVHRIDHQFAPPMTTAAINGGISHTNKQQQQSERTHLPRIAILNRKGTRRLIGAHNISSLLQDVFDLPYRPPVFFLDDLSFEEQVEAFNSIDIMLSPHGAQLTSVLFMARCSSIIEVLPHAYDWNDYYGTMAALSGVNHSYIYLGTDRVAETEAASEYEAQVEARKPPLCAPAHRMVEAVKIQVEQWNRCCGFRQ